MDTQPIISLANLSLWPNSPRVIVGILKGRERESQTELIARLALGGPFHLITGGEWLPDQDSMETTVGQYTTAVEETLDHPLIGRPSTCLQLFDQLVSAEAQHLPILVLDFLHFFYDPDLDLSLRLRVLEKCCQRVKELSRSKSVILLVHYSPLEEYQLFLPLLESIADEVLEAEESSGSNGSGDALIQEDIMGRHLLSVTGLADKLIDNLKPIVGELSPKGQRIIENFIEIILQQRNAIAAATGMLPMNAALVVWQVEEHQRNDREFAELYQQIDGLNRKIEELNQKIEELTMKT